MQSGPKPVSELVPAAHLLCVPEIIVVNNIRDTQNV